MISKTSVRRVLLVNPKISDPIGSRDALETIACGYGTMTFDCANCLGDSFYYLSKYYYDAIIVSKSVCGIDSSIYSCICNICHFPPPIIISDEIFNKQCNDSDYDNFIQEKYDDALFFTKIKKHFDIYESLKSHNHIKLNKASILKILKNFTATNCLKCERMLNNI